MTKKCRVFNECRAKKFIEAGAFADMCKGKLNPGYLPGTKIMCSTLRTYYLDRTNHDPVGDKSL